MASKVEFYKILIIFGLSLEKKRMRSLYLGKSEQRIKTIRTHFLVMSYVIRYSSFIGF